MIRGCHNRVDDGYRLLGIFTAVKLRHTPTTQRDLRLKKSSVSLTGACRHRSAPSGAVWVVKFYYCPRVGFATARHVSSDELRRLKAARSLVWRRLAATVTIRSSHPRVPPGLATPRPAVERMTAELPRLPTFHIRVMNDIPTPKM